MAVVFDGPIFQATLVNGEWELNEIDYGLIQRTFRPNYDYLTRPLSYTIDVVKREYFSKYLSKVENDIQILIKKIESNIENVSKYLERPNRRGVVV